MKPVEDLLAAWRDAERAADALEPGTPDQASAEREAIRLRREYQELVGSAPSELSVTPEAAGDRSRS